MQEILPGLKKIAKDVKFIPPDKTGEQISSQHSMKPNLSTAPPVSQSEVATQNIPPATNVKRDPIGRDSESMIPLPVGAGVKSGAVTVIEDVSSACKTSDPPPYTLTSLVRFLKPILI